MKNFAFVILRILEFAFFLKSRVFLMSSIDITCLSTNISQTLQVNNSRIARIKNANFSENYFYMNYFYMNLFYIFIGRLH